MMGQIFVATLARVSSKVTGFKEVVLVSFFTSKFVNFS